jgi:pentatricopeptide repeat protein
MEAVGLHPDVAFFSNVLKSVAASGRKDAGRRAEEILDVMDRMHREGYERVKPNTVAFTIAIKSCVNAGDTERVQALLERMTSAGAPPDTWTYNEVLLSASQSGGGVREAAERAEQLLTEMKNLSLSHNLDVSPDAVSYNTVLKLWSRVAEGDMPASADRMWMLCEQMKEDDIKLDLATYSTLIVYLSKTGRREDVEGAESLLHEMEAAGLRPDHRYFHPVLCGWLNVRDAQRAENVLVQWVNAFVDEEKSDGLPHPRNFINVIRAWIAAREPEKAALVLALFEALGGKLTKRPSRRTYERVLQAWKESNHPDRMDHISKLEAKLVQWTV